MGYLFPNHPQVYKAEATRRLNLRSRVFYLQDQVTLASFHRRPKPEVDLLLEELKEAIAIAKES